MKTEAIDSVADNASSIRRSVLSRTKNTERQRSRLGGFIRLHCVPYNRVTFLIACLAILSSALDLSSWLKPLRDTGAWIFAHTENKNVLVGSLSILLFLYIWQSFPSRWRTGWSQWLMHLGTTFSGLSYLILATQPSLVLALENSLQSQVVFAETHRWAAALIWSLLFIFTRRPRRLSRHSTTQPDAPIFRREDDLLGREHLVRRCAHALTNTAYSPSVALVGPMGCGKTTIANLAAESLRNQGHIVAVFRASHHRPKHIEFALREAIQQALVPRRPSVFRATMQALRRSRSKPGAQYEERIRQELARNFEYLPEGQRLVLFIDDLDRCEPEAIRKILVHTSEVLRAPRLSYLFAFDHTEFKEKGVDVRAIEKFVDDVMDVPNPSGTCLSRLDQHILDMLQGDAPKITPSSQLCVALPPNPRRRKKTWRRSIDAGALNPPYELNAEYLVALVAMEINTPGYLLWLSEAPEERAPCIGDGQWRHRVSSQDRRAIRPSARIDSSNPQLGAKEPDGEWHDLYHFASGLMVSAEKSRDHIEYLLHGKFLRLDQLGRALAAGEDIPEVGEEWSHGLSWTNQCLVLLEVAAAYLDEYISMGNTELFQYPVQLKKTSEIFAHCTDHLDRKPETESVEKVLARLWEFITRHQTAVADDEALYRRYIKLIAETVYRSDADFPMYYERLRNIGGSAKQRRAAALVSEALAPYALELMRTRFEDGIALDRSSDLWSFDEHMIFDESSPLVAALNSNRRDHELRDVEMSKEVYLRIWRRIFERTSESLDVYRAQQKVVSQRGWRKFFLAPPQSLELNQTEWKHLNKALKITRPSSKIPDAS